MMAEDYLRAPWYPQPNDLIGGWCLMLVDDPPSQGGLMVGDLLDEAIARHIAQLHNQQLGIEHAADHQ